ncbi:class I SAM-dependent methyltransferase [Lacicoccus alkaliphilus]|uniref:16S rRNA (Guanine1207-N2)-methyltransferase n=1 Tax=Lacicoccus alkaliphilus DSM 16010 TaxID=1123231 RepID=A0A1M7I1T3_9BACL|nr:methyltransferase [Salinicoccus alkaliphilus]SHM34675.1 16S rRNA (guanine1207-N2)-methyltransferase [Salinicoccus alkaliphilus DSM 16010]
MSHYFTTDEGEHDFSEISFDFHGETYKFKTDRGVFSRGQVDYGTRTLLEGVVSDAGKEYSTLIDMGAGYGPLGIVLGSVLKIDPVMVEVNEDAIGLLHENVRKNGVNAEIFNREEYDRSDAAAELYVTNPPFRAGKETVMGIIADGFERLREGGSFYMVVQKKQGMKSYKGAIENTFGNASVVMKDRGYHVLKGVK